MKVNTQEKFYNITNKSLSELGVANHKELWDKVGKDYEGLSMELPATFEKSLKTTKKGEEKEIYIMTLSTADEDRHGEIVFQDWDLKWFKKNPVLLDSHNYSSIEHIIGKLKNIKVVDNKLQAEVVFNLANSKGVLAKEMVDGGFLNANSVGFIPKEFDDKGNILKSELLEDSLVSVPANARALFEKKVKEVEIEVEEMKKEVEEDTTIHIIKLNSIDKKQVILKSIKTSLIQLQKEERMKEKRMLFQTLRNL